MSLLKDCPCHNQLIHDLGCTEYAVEEQLMMMLIPRQCSYGCENHCSIAERTTNCAGYHSCSKDENRFICSDKQLNENDNANSDEGGTSPIQGDGFDPEDFDLDDFDQLRGRRDASGEQVYTWTEWTDSIESHSILDFFTQFQRKFLMLFSAFIIFFFKLKLKLWKDENVFVA